MKKNKRYFFPVVKKTFICVIAVFLIYSLTKTILDYQKKISFFENYQKDLQKEREKNKQLKSDMVKNHDYYTVEKNIRQKLNLLQPDEFAIIMSRPTPTPVPLKTPTKSSQQQWWDLFF